MEDTLTTYKFLDLDPIKLKFHVKSMEYSTESEESLLLQLTMIMRNVPNEIQS